MRQFGKGLLSTITQGSKHTLYSTLSQTTKLLSAPKLNAAEEDKHKFYLNQKISLLCNGKHLGKRQFFESLNALQSFFVTRKCINSLPNVKIID